MSKNLIGVVAAVLIGLGLYFAFAANDDTTSPTPAATPTAGGSSRAVPPPVVQEGTPSTPPQKPGVNPALARAQQLGGKAVPVEGQLEPKLPGEIGRSAMAPGPPEVPAPNAAKAGDTLSPKKPWPINREGIRGAVNEALPEMKECYEEWLKVSPKLGGRVVVAFTISAVEGQESGKVTEVALGDQTLGHKPMEGCLLNVVSDLKFAKPADGQVKVSYPIHFAGGELDAGP